MTEALLSALGSLLGEDAVLTGEAARERCVSSWCRVGAPIALVRPSNTREVSAVLALCNQYRMPITPVGGKTGPVGGTLADGTIALSLDRMSRIEEVDVLGSTMTVEAGCILQTAAECAQAQKLLIPLDLGARGSATVGGVISTNAGGNSVIRYGMTRDMVLGLEAVLADGTVVSSMNSLIKNNAGYDIKQLFIGTEGTLGVLTRAVLRLRPLPTTQETALVGVETFGSVATLLRRMERGLSGNLHSFEVMWKEFHELVTSEPAIGRPILSGKYPYYVLIEARGVDEDNDATRFESLLAGALDSGLIADAVIAKRQSEREAFWALRDDVGQLGRNWPILTFDVSLPIDEIESYVAEVRAALTSHWPGIATLVIFGHLGDGNIHVVVGVGSRDKQTRRAVEQIVYGGLKERRGSISAEHGIGIEKRDYLELSRTPAEIALMHLLKATLDPHNIMNPGKVLRPQQHSASARGGKV